MGMSDNEKGFLALLICVVFFIVWGIAGDDVGIPLGMGLFVVLVIGLIFQNRFWKSKKERNSEKAE
jgi:O-antigen/teichoic acid export membrane protein